MPASGPFGSVRGVPGNGHPYRDPRPFADRRQSPSDRYAATVRAPSCRRVRQRIVNSVIFERLPKELHDFCIEVHMKRRPIESRGAGADGRG
jgi:hypothetical protein